MSKPTIMKAITKKDKRIKTTPDSVSKAQQLASTIHAGGSYTIKKGKPVLKTNTDIDTQQPSTGE